MECVCSGYSLKYAIKRNQFYNFTFEQKSLMTFMKIIQNLFVKLEIILYYDVEFVASSNKPHN